MSLLVVRDALRSGRITHVPSFTVIRDTSKYRARTKRLGFNMSIPAAATDRGFVGCIGAYLYIVQTRGSLPSPDLGDMTVDLDAINAFVANGDEIRTGFDRLLYPFGTDYSLSGITPQAAANRIDEYLTTGQPEWGSWESCSLTR